ncbi:MAG: sugar ABC transporter substrate-binding protein, partial [Butyricicoccaceae bacterium]
LAGAMTVSLAACGSTGGGTEAGSGSGSSEHTITVILKTLNSDYWQACAAGIRQAESDLGCKVLLQGPPSETSYDEQLNMIETTLADSEVEALVIAPLQPESAANAVKDATIPILTVDTTMEADNLLSYIGLSNEDATAAGGEYVAEKLGGSGNVIILAGVEGDTTSEDRIVGWTKGLEKGGCTVLATQYTDAVADKATDAITGLMEIYPDQIDAVVCHSDDVAVGVTNALESVGKEDEILVCGFGGISGAEPVKDGRLDATVDIGPYEMGYNCVVHALEAIEGKEIESFYATEPTIIDSSNVDEFLDKLAEWTK